MPGLASADSNVLDAPQVSVPDTDTPAKGATVSPPPIDTVEETIESVLDPVQDATKPITDAAKPVTDPADKTVDTVTDTIDEGTTPVTDVIDDPKNPITDGNGSGGTTRNPPPDPTSDDRPGGSLAPVTGGDVATRSGGTGPAVRAPSRLPAGGPAAAVMRARPAGAAPGDAAASPASVGGVVSASTTSAAEQVSRAVVDASRAFRFPLLVAAALLLFLAIQGRVDSRDPKLAHSKDDEELMFA